MLFQAPVFNVGNQLTKNNDEWLMAKSLSNIYCQNFMLYSIAVLRTM